jgi:hypothetical protein
MSSHISSFFDDLGEGGRFHCNLSRAYGVEAYLNRYGTWSDPWTTAIEPSLIMPKYDPQFNLTFSEVTDRRALDLKKVITDTGKNIILSYSGGIDSTTCLVSILKNFNAEELKKVKISMSADSIVENPIFYLKYIKDKIETYDIMKNMFTDYVDNDIGIPVTADLGDWIFGTELGVKMYSQIPELEKIINKTSSKFYSDRYYKISSTECHYSTYRDILILYFNKNFERGIKNLESQYFTPKNLTQTNKTDLMFGELLYEKIHKNILTSDIPVHSLHDFFWWSMFNMRFAWGSFRAGMNYGSADNMKHMLNGKILNWYGSTEYQLWSMANNNTGEKINGTTQSSYKRASRNYIYEFDKNKWYYDHKMKLQSLPIVSRRNWKKNFNNFDKKFGFDSNYDVLKLDQPGINEYIQSGLMSYKIDWM